MAKETAGESITSGYFSGQRDQVVKCGWIGWKLR